MTYKQVAYPRTYCVFDFETTGLNPETDHIVEVAALQVKDGEVVRAWNGLLYHGDDFHIPEEATAIHNITDAMCKEGGQDPKLMLETLANLIMESGACVTHNGFRFDVPFFVWAARRYGLTSQIAEQLMGERHIDTAVLYKANKLPLVRQYDEPMDSFAKRVMETKAYGLKFSVTTCCNELGIEIGETQMHRALGDVMLTNKIYQHIAL